MSEREVRELLERHQFTTGHNVDGGFECAECRWLYSGHARNCPVKKALSAEPDVVAVLRWAKERRAELFEEIADEPLLNPLFLKGKAGMAAEVQGFIQAAFGICLTDEGWEWIEENDSHYDELTDEEGITLIEHGKNIGWTERGWIEKRRETMASLSEFDTAKPCEFNVAKEQDAVGTYRWAYQPCNNIATKAWNQERQRWEYYCSEHLDAMADLYEVEERVIMILRKRRELCLVSST